MGDRANVLVKDGKSEVYLYTHWMGSELPETLRQALARGESRWDDGQYLARIIFNEMTRGSEDGTTGYGISSVIGDGGDRVLVVDTRAGTVHERGTSATWPIADYATSPDGRPRSWSRE